MRPALVGLLTVATTVIAAAAPQPASALRASAGQASRNWKQLSSEHFIVQGTASGKALQDWVKKLETFRASLSEIFPSADLSSPVPNKVIVLDSTRDFYPLLWLGIDGKIPTSVGGYFRRHDDANYFVVNTASMDPEWVIYHEYSHYLFHRIIRGQMPTWLSEGLAEFFATFFVDKQKRVGVVGGISPRLDRLRMTERWLPFSQLTEVTAMNAWRGQIDGDMYYAQAWALVHYLLIGAKENRPGQLFEYILATTSGKPAAQAFAQAFRATPEQLQLEVRGYVRTRRFPARAIPLMESSPKEISVRPMLEWEEQLIRGRILTMSGRLDEADAALTAAGAAMPEDPDISYAMAVLRREQRRSDEVVALLKALAAQRPEGFAAHLELGRALADTGRHDLALDSLDRAIALGPSNAPTWLDLSLTLAALGHRPEADALMGRAMTLSFEPSWYRVRSTRAWRLGLNELAFHDAAKYVSIAGPDDDKGSYAAFLGALAGRKAKLDKEVNALLERVAGTVMRGSWPATIVSFLQKQMDAQTFVGKAKGKGQLTEAHGYAGLSALVEGRDLEARPHLDWVLKEGLRNYGEYSMVVDAVKMKK